MSSEGPITRSPDDAEHLWFFGTLTSVRVSAEERGDVAIVRQVLPPGLETPLHRQRDDPETFHVLEGELEFFAADERFAGGPGATVHVPAGLTHGFRVGPEGAAILIVTTGQHVQFFRAAGEPAAGPELPPPAEPDFGRLGAAAEAHGVEILGPLPA